MRFMLRLVSEKTHKSIRGSSSSSAIVPVQASRGSQGMDPGMAMLMQGMGQMMQTFMQGMGRGAGTGSHRDVPNIRIHKKGSSGSLHEHHSPPLGVSPVLSARTATDSQPSDVQYVNGEDGFVE